jgi:hypothetical protein
VIKGRPTTLLCAICTAMPDKVAVSAGTSAARTGYGAYEQVPVTSVVTPGRILLMMVYPKMCSTARSTGRHGA